MYVTGRHSVVNLDNLFVWVPGVPVIGQLEAALHGGNA